MQTSSYASRLRYLDAHDVDDSVVDFDGLDVRGRDGEKLGGVDGFIVDLASGRVLYVVVDSGGWFRSRRFLAPIGHAVIDQARRALSLDITKDRLHGYPEFDEARFSEFTDSDLRTFEARMAEVCCPEEPVEDVTGAGSPTWAYDTRRHYRQPDWWTGGAYVHERLRPVESPAYRVVGGFDEPPARR
jgi:PRC-barrel domain protein